MSETKTKVSHRSTTSSRTPGKVNTGSVVSVVANLIICADCGRRTTDYVVPGRHGLRMVVRDGRVLAVNCQQKEVDA